MKAYLIDTDAKTVTEVDYSGNYRDIYKLCGYSCFTTVELTEERDTLFVDDEGLLKGPVFQFFGFLGYAQPLAGNGLILGTNEEGESIAPAKPIEFYKERLCWIERGIGRQWAVRKVKSRGTQHMSLSDIEQFLSKPL